MEGVLYVDDAAVLGNSAKDQGIKITSGSENIVKDGLLKDVGDILHSMEGIYAPLVMSTRELVSFSLKHLGIDSNKITIPYGQEVDCSKILRLPYTSFCQCKEVQKAIAADREFEIKLRKLEEIFNIIDNAWLLLINIGVSIKSSIPPVIFREAVEKISNNDYKKFLSKLYGKNLCPLYYEKAIFRDDSFIIKTIKRLKILFEKIIIFFKKIFGKYNLCTDNIPLFRFILPVNENVDKLQKLVDDKVVIKQLRDFLMLSGPLSKCNKKRAYTLLRDGSITDAKLSAIFSVGAAISINFMEENIKLDMMHGPGDVMNELLKVKKDVDAKTDPTSEDLISVREIASNFSIYSLLLSELRRRWYGEDITKSIDLEDRNVINSFINRTGVGSNLADHILKELNIGEDVKRSDLLSNLENLHDSFINRWGHRDKGFAKYYFSDQVKSIEFIRSVNDARIIFHSLIDSAYLKVCAENQGIIRYFCSLGVDENIVINSLVVSWLFSLGILGGPINSEDKNNKLISLMQKKFVCAKTDWKEFSQAVLGAPVKDSVLFLGDDREPDELKEDNPVLYALGSKIGETVLKYTLKEFGLDVFLEEKSSHLTSKYKSVYDYYNSVCPGSFQCVGNNNSFIACGGDNLVKGVLTSAGVGDKGSPLYRSVLALDKRINSISDINILLALECVKEDQQSSSYAPVKREFEGVAQSVKELQHIPDTLMSDIKSPKCLGKVRGLYKCSTKEEIEQPLLVEV